MSEVETFQTSLADPARPREKKARAYARIVRNAARLNPHDAGFERAGVALKDALLAWLDSQSAPSR